MPRALPLHEPEAAGVVERLPDEPLLHPLAAPRVNDEGAGDARQRLVETASCSGGCRSAAPLTPMPPLAIDAADP